MTDRKAKSLSPRQKGTSRTADVVCFGMITPAVVLVVDDFPPHNTGMLIREIGEFISDDAALVACMLWQWDVKSGLIGTALGNDSAGHRVAHQLKELGIIGDVRFSEDIRTPFEVIVSDPSGARTYFWQRSSEVLVTLANTDLSLLEGAHLLYVDWYDGNHILRPIEAASQLDVLVFLNLEYGHQNIDILQRYTKGVDICQVVTDPAQRDTNPIAVARKVQEAGVPTVLVTLGIKGCLAVRGQETLRILSPEVKVVDGCGAGAAFSAGFAYGYLKGWDLEQTARFATAAASLKCTVVGPRAFPVNEVSMLAGQLQMERLPT